MDMVPFVWREKDVSVIDDGSGRVVTSRVLVS